jgi:broad specificity phosphatase PhoE
MGDIILARHGEPALSRKIRLTAEGYREWWARYETGGLKPGQTPPPGLQELALTVSARRVSPRLRAQETAAALGKHLTFEVDPHLIEAPLPPPNFPRFLRFSPSRWGVIARLWWWFLNHHDPGEETRAQAEVRAAAVADRLIAAARDGDVLVVAHGFFNAMIGRALKKRGWRRVVNQGYRYWRHIRWAPPGA